MGIKRVKTKVITEDSEKDEIITEIHSKKSEVEMGLPEIAKVEVGKETVTVEVSSSEIAATDTSKTQAETVVEINPEGNTEKEAKSSVKKYPAGAVVATVEVTYNSDHKYEQISSDGSSETMESLGRIETWTFRGCISGTSYTVNLSTYIARTHC